MSLRSWDDVSYSSRQIAKLAALSNSQVVRRATIVLLLSLLEGAMFGRLQFERYQGLVETNRPHPQLHTCVPPNLEEMN